MSLRYADGDTTGNDPGPFGSGKKYKKSCGSGKKYKKSCGGETMN